MKQQLHRRLRGKPLLSLRPLSVSLFLSLVFVLHSVSSFDENENANHRGSESECGVSDIEPKVDSRIVGGVKAKPHSWPWQVALTGPINFCGGSIFSSHWVITAAHCVESGDPADYKIVLGDHNIEEPEGTEKEFDVKEIIGHEKYDSNTNENDIALIRLSEDVEFNRYIKPICLPDDDVKVGTRCVATGWGRTQSTDSRDVLNQVYLPVINNSQCNHPDWNNGYIGQVKDNMICAGYPEGGKSICIGDSGGPLACLSEGKWKLHGLTSFFVTVDLMGKNKTCAMPRRPGIFTRVNSYTEWIREKTEQAEFGIPYVKPKVDSRIVGGEEAKPHSWPWQVSIQLLNKGKWMHDCGGSIFHPHWVITAAHCVESVGKYDYKIVLGAHDKLDYKGTEQEFEIEEVIIHEKYNKKPVRNDIALIRLSGDVEFNRYIKPISLPDYDVKVGTRCVATGWGETQSTRNENVLNQVSLPVISNRRCNKPNWYDGKVKDDMICAGYPEGKRSTCFGDSGGPLACLSQGKWKLFGLTSWGGVDRETKRCALPLRPSVFTRVNSYTDWIRENIERYD